MSRTAQNRLLRFLPGTGTDRGVAVVFYIYVAVCLTRLQVFLETLASPVLGTSLSAVVVLIGALLLYGVAVFPALLQGDDRRKRVAAWKNRFRAHRAAVLGLWLCLVFVVVSLLAPLLAPYDPVVQNEPTLNRYQAPSPEHPMGTDKFGRDVLSRVLYGSRVSLVVAAVAVGFASLLGLILGAFSGYFGGWIDEIAMRLVDGLLAFPRLLLVLTLLAFFANSLWLVVALLAATGWMGIARLVRAARRGTISRNCCRGG